MLTYLNSFFSGDVDPLWPHIVLLTASVLASFAVGGGIIFESPKYSEAVHRVATKLVIIGVVVEAICTIVLFVFDEGISSKQQSTIEAQQKKVIALEERLAARTISKSQSTEMIVRLSRFAGQQFQVSPYPDDQESIDAGNQIAAVLKKAGWIQLPLAENVIGPASVIAGVQIVALPAQKAAKDALIVALIANGIAAKAHDPIGTPQALPISINVGIKP